MPDVLKLAIDSLFTAYPTDEALARAVFEFRANEAAKEAAKKKPAKLEAAA